ncbi:transposase [Kiritimatiellaeota bacterium B1221]|nr:transposase [Kiritimatiellaeota bacterium B1221]
MSRVFYNRKKDDDSEKTKYSDSQILAILKQAESGMKVPDLCREHGMSAATFYKWRDLHLFESIEQVQELATQWMWSYNHERPHTAWGGITPQMKLEVA